MAVLSAPRWVLIKGGLKPPPEGQWTKKQSGVNPFAVNHRSGLGGEDAPRILAAQPWTRGDEKKTGAQSWRAYSKSTGRAPLRCMALVTLAQLPASMAR